ncbi:ABC transporter substrate-binding protein [Mucilaginibacter sp. RS28]|uniref:ABC transporter substrate-binding protein n=1 Tax=Mucilaginibacter straminoryzae TaxID=2932774 RepID=A0A9X1X620_9SPHI|nr:ABC transporter substrate-binding protein [Mucilaginibacter straminoryzae]MCJ8210298.1 ABC transporter substrate-binding protein [Mucilaginibacter straminoryzae]
MISARNHRQLSSGNNPFWILVLLVLVAACSPKVRKVEPKPVNIPAKTIEKPVNKPLQPLPPPLEQRFNTVSMLLPFNLQNLDAGKSYKKADLQSANMAVDYYQGFKLALDSLTAQGYNYRLQVFDSKDLPAETRALALNPKVRNSDMVVGPVFPDGIKAFSAVSAIKPELSPLSPASPAEARNPMLITAIPPLEYHARRTAQYVHQNLKAKKVFMLKSGFSADNKYLVPFKKSLDTLSKLKVKAIPFTVVRGSLTSLLPQLSKTEPNVFVIGATNQAFLQLTLRSLDTLAKHYPVVLIGHPSWERMTFLKADLLQRLKTVITSADHVNYKAANTRDFIKAFRKAYHAEPSEYAIKAFDEGYYFGLLLAQANGSTIKPEGKDYQGLHNKFHFVKKAGEGWVNTNVTLLKYVNFELKAIE